MGAKIESILFLLCFLGVPILMMGILIYRVVAFIVAKTRLSRALGDGPWKRFYDDSVVRRALEDAEVRPERARFFDVVATEGHDGWNGKSEPLLAMRCRWKFRRGPAQKHTAPQPRRLVVIPYDGLGVRGVVQHRAGGLLERTALAVADALGAQADDIPGWEWAIVHHDGSGWLDAELSEKLKAHLAEGERLHIGARYLVLSVPDGPIVDLLPTAEDRARGLVDDLTR